MNKQRSVRRGKSQNHREDLIKLAVFFLVNTPIRWCSVMMNFPRRLMNILPMSWMCSLNVKTGKELVLKQNSYRILNYVPPQEHQHIKKHDRVGPPGCLHTVHTGCYGAKIQASVYFCFITGKQFIRVLLFPACILMLTLRKPGSLTSYICHVTLASCKFKVFYWSYLFILK